MLKSKKSVAAVSLPVIESSLPVPLPGRDYTLKLPKGHLSHSQIEQYLGCGEQYRRNYVLGEPRRVSDSLAEGQAWHSLMRETNTTKLTKGKHITIRRAEDFHEGYCHLEAEKVDDWQGSNVKDWIKRGEKFIADLWKNDGPIYEPVVMPDGKPGVEWETRIEIAGVPIVVISDLVEADCVVDYKVAGDASRYDSMKSNQIAINQIATGKNCGLFEVFEKRSGRKRVISSKRTVEQCLRWMEFVVSHVAMGISNGVFLPTDPMKNTLCDVRWCNYFKTCRGACNNGTNC